MCFSARHVNDVILINSLALFSPTGANWSTLDRPFITVSVSPTGTGIDNFLITGRRDVGPQQGQE